MRTGTSESSEDSSFIGSERPEVMNAGIAKELTSQHTLFECARWANSRRVPNLECHDVITKEYICGLMMHSREMWNKLTGTLRNIMKTKGRDEILRQDR
ncbi:hypothetical protein JTB14_027250 [Gonioctena quinquepunctata]|nr:hypothetical protein JTB14_027250 [Gonioctena quinquepunctata]